MKTEKQFAGKVMSIQAELKAPKNQYNNFGKYSYRNLEDILEALKPLLKKNELILSITDEIKEAGGVPFVEAVAIVSDGVTDMAVRAQAGIDLNRKGMDVAQSFGASSSYARKYALNGLFLIDDTKDADATNKHGKSDSPTKKKMTPEIMTAMIDAINDGAKDAVKSRIGGYNMTKAQRDKLNKLLK
jgi:hypothetical protein